MRISIQPAEPSAMVHSDGLARDHWQVVDHLSGLELGGALNTARDTTHQPAPAADDDLVQANESWLAVAATSERQLQAMSNPASVAPSRVVSKFIGETEKSLDLAFGHAQPCCALLSFDEADPLFGKRSDVKDSDD